MKLYITCLTYSYPHYVRHPFDIVHLPNSCKATMESFFLLSKKQVISEVNVKRYKCKIYKFEGRYDKLNCFTLMQAFNLIPLSDKMLAKLTPTISELQKISFQYINNVLQK